VARETLLRALVLGLVLGAAGCGGKEEEAPEVDMAALRARRDSIRQAAVQDSIARARYTACSDSVVQVLGRSAEGKRRLQTSPAGFIQPEVTEACGPAPAARPAQVAAAPDNGAKPAAPDTTQKPEAPAPQPQAAAPAAQPPKPALTPQQLQVQRADSIRQARERAKQDSLRQLAERRAADSIAKVQRDSVRAESLKVAKETEVVRETFTYSGGARDPFVSLISQDKVGPEYNDLLLVAVYLDPRRAANSIAILRDKTNQKRYTLRVGERLGRLKVAQIRQTDVVFTVEDIGFERQETLSLRKREEQTP
jgi:hypothetical protein